MRVQVPLIALLPLKSQLIERLEVLTMLDLSMAEQTEATAEHLEDDIMVSLGSKGSNSAEIKLVVSAVDVPDGHGRCPR